jgi:DNA transformation protein
MGTKGDKKTSAAKAMAEAMVSRLAPVGDVKAHSMFGGYGLYVEAVMFGLVNTAGTFHMRVSDATRDEYDKGGGKPHGKMPYYSVPEAVMKDPENLCAWTAEAVEIAQAARRKKLDRRRE